MIAVGAANVILLGAANVILPGAASVILPGVTGLIAVTDIRPWDVDPPLPTGDGG